MKTTRDFDIPPQKYIHALTQDLQLHKDSKKFLEALENIPVLLDTYPLSSYVDPTFILIGEVFLKTADNSIRSRILKIVKKSCHHFEAISDFSKVKEGVYHILFSTDDVAKILTANYLALFSQFMEQDEFVVDIIKQYVHSTDISIAKYAFEAMKHYASYYPIYAANQIRFLIESYYEYPSERVTVFFIEQLLDVCSTFSIGVVDIDIAFKTLANDVYLKTKPDIVVYVLKFLAKLSVESLNRREFVIARILTFVHKTVNRMERLALIQLLGYFVDTLFFWPENLVRDVISITNDFVHEAKVDYKEEIGELTKYLSSLRAQNISSIKTICNFIMDTSAKSKYITDSDLLFVYRNVIDNYAPEDIKDVVQLEKLFILFKNDTLDSKILFAAMRSYLSKNITIPLYVDVYDFCKKEVMNEKRTDRVGLYLKVIRAILDLEHTFSSKIESLIDMLFEKEIGIQTRVFYELVYHRTVSKTVDCNLWIKSIPSFDHSLLFEIAMICLINGHWQTAALPLFSYLSKSVTSVNSKIWFRSIICLCQSQITTWNVQNIENSIENQEMAVGTLHEVASVSQNTRNMRVIHEFLTIRTGLFSKIMNAILVLDNSDAKINDQFKSQTDYQKFLFEEFQFEIVELNELIKMVSLILYQSLDADSETHMQMFFLSVQINLLKTLLSYLIGENKVDYTDVLKEREEDYIKVQNEEAHQFSLKDIQSYDKMPSKQYDKTLSNDFDLMPPTRKSDLPSKTDSRLWDHAILEGSTTGQFNEATECVYSTSDAMDIDILNTVNSFQFYYNKQYHSRTKKGANNADFKALDRIQFTTVDWNLIQGMEKKYKEHDGRPDYSGSLLHADLYVKYIGDLNWTKLCHILQTLKTFSPKNLNEMLKQKALIMEGMLIAFKDYRVIIPFIAYSTSETKVNLYIHPKEEVNDSREEYLFIKGGMPIFVESILKFKGDKFKFECIIIEIQHFEGLQLKELHKKEIIQVKADYIKMPFLLNIANDGHIKVILSCIESQSKIRYLLEEKTFTYKVEVNVFY
uniref:Non-specific serine/threonine protein kinase n=1 Tax=Rhabditophanes sp. KR3021 TaxID=114890 RepID=A0AC35TQD3_9BILA